MGPRKRKILMQNEDGGQELKEEDEEEQENKRYLASLPTESPAAKKRRALVGTLGALNVPETRGRKAGQQTSPSKPASELSKNPKTVQNRERFRALPEEYKILQRKQNADNNARHYVKQRLFKKNSNGIPINPDFYALTPEEQNKYLEERYEELAETRFRQGISAEAYEVELTKKLKAEEEKTWKLAKDILKEPVSKTTPVIPREENMAPGIGTNFLRRMDSIVKNYEKKTWMRGPKMLAKMGSLKPNEEFLEFAKQVVDKEGIEKNVKYEWTAVKPEVSEDDDEGLENVPHIKTKEGVVVVLEDDDEDNLDDEEEPSDFIVSDTSDDSAVNSEDEESDGEKMDED